MKIQLLSVEVVDETWHEDGESHPAFRVHARIAIGSYYGTIFGEALATEELAQADMIVLEHKLNSL